MRPVSSLRPMSFRPSHVVLTSMLTPVSQQLGGLEGFTTKSTRSRCPRSLQDLLLQYFTTLPSLLHLRVVAPHPPHLPASFASLVTNKQKFDSRGRSNQKSLDAAA
mmetsp:Transcript_6366/g.22686  ORF Transcript_6366/g.22686 Transcript_6366/m.22686 type:complete len:106 (-) Transcript_6366:871-1188(-)